MADAAQEAANDGDAGHGAARHRPRHHIPPAGTGEGLDLGQLAQALRQNVRLIVAVGLVVFCLVMANTLMSRLEFGSSGRLYLGELELSGKSGSARGQEIDLSGGVRGDIGSEVEIIKSQSLLRRTILESGRNVTVTPAGWNPPRFWQWLAARRDPALLNVGQELSAAQTTLTADAQTVKRVSVRFSSASEYEVHDEERRLGKGRLGETSKLPGLSLRLARGKERGPRPGDEYQLEIKSLDETISEVLKTLEVSWPRPIAQGEMAKVVTLQTTHSSPFMATQFLQVLMEAYLQERQSWKMEDATTAEAFVTGQLQTMRESLGDTEQRMADYRSQTRGVVLDDEAEAMIQQIGKYEEQRVAARLEMAALADVKRALKTPNSPIEAYLFGEAKDSVLQGLASNLSEARQKLTDLEARFHPTAPDVKEQRAQVEAQLGAIRNYVGSRLSRAQDNLATFNHLIGQFEEKLKSVPGAKLGLAQLSRESEVYSRLYSYLLERQQQAAIIKASNVSKNRILDRPQLPHREHSPKLKLSLAVSMLGFLLGAIFVVLRRTLASTYQSESEIRTSLGDVPVFASVPRPPAPRGLSSAKASPLKLLVAAPYSGFAEAFRLLRTNLYHAGAPATSKVVLLTSPTPGDGKTTCALSLAAMLGADRKRVLLIDGDLRKPSHHLFTGTNQGGLSELLADEVDFGQAVRTIETPMGSFDAMNAGAAAHTELLSSPRLDDLLRYTRLRYDFVLIDTASFPLVSDALLLSRKADCVLTVLRVHNTPRKLAAEHMQVLAANASEYAVVVNGIAAPQPYGYPPPRTQRRTDAPRRAAPGKLAPAHPRRSGLGWLFSGALVLMGGLVFTYAAGGVDSGLLEPAVQAGPRAAAAQARPRALAAHRRPEGSGALAESPVGAPTPSATLLGAASALEAAPTPSAVEDVTAPALDRPTALAAASVRARAVPRAASRSKPSAARPGARHTSAASTVMPAQLPSEDSPLPSNPF